MSLTTDDLNRSRALARGWESGHPDRWQRWLHGELQIIQRPFVDHQRMERPWTAYVQLPEGHRPASLHEQFANLIDAIDWVEGEMSVAPRHRWLRAWNDCRRDVAAWLRAAADRVDVP